MAEYTRLLIFDCRFLISHANMHLAEKIQHKNMEKSSSYKIIIELLGRRDTAKYSQRKNPTINALCCFSELSWGEKTSSSTPLVNTGGKKSIISSNNRIKLVAAKVSMAAESTPCLGLPALSQKSPASVAPSRPRLRGPALPLQPPSSSCACGSAG